MQSFGAKCYVHIDKELRKKHENTAKEMRLLGYEAYNIFRVQDLEINEIYYKRDVRFSAELRHEDLNEEPEIEALEEDLEDLGDSSRQDLLRKKDGSGSQLDSERSEQ